MTSSIEAQRPGFIVLSGALGPSGGAHVASPYIYVTVRHIYVTVRRPGRGHVHPVVRMVRLLTVGVACAGARTVFRSIRWYAWCPSLMLW